MPGEAAAPYDFTRYSVLTPAGPDEPDPQLFAKLRRLVYGEHRVKKGEYSAYQLAKTFNTTPMSLQTTNNDELLILNPGRRLVVHNKDGQLYEVRKATETLDQIVAKYHRDRAGAVKFKEAVVYANSLPGGALINGYEFTRGAKVLLPKVTVSFDSYRFPFQGWGW